MSVKRCQQEVDRREYLEWLLLYEQEPWGEHRRDMRMATLATLLANIMSVIVRLGGGRATRSYHLDDFLPGSARRLRPAQAPIQAQAIFRAFVAASQP